MRRRGERRQEQPKVPRRESRGCVVNLVSTNTSARGYPHRLRRAPRSRMTRHLPVAPGSGASSSRCACTAPAACASVGWRQVFFFCAEGRTVQRRGCLDETQQGLPARRDDRAAPAFSWGGVEQLVAREVHTLEVAGSSPAPASSETLSGEALQTQGGGEVLDTHAVCDRKRERMSLGEQGGATAIAASNFSHTGAKQVDETLQASRRHRRADATYTRGGLQALSTLLLPLFPKPTLDVWLSAGTAATLSLRGAA